MKNDYSSIPVESEDDENEVEDLDTPRLHTAFSAGKLQYIHRQYAGWDCLVLRDWADYVPMMDIESWISAPCQETVKDAPCRTITFCTIQKSGKEYAVYTKYMRAQNDGVFAKHELFSMFKWFVEPSRGKRIARTTAMMIAKGYPCPATVLGGRFRNRFGYPHEVIISFAIDCPTVEECFCNRDEAGREELIRLCGSRLAALHRDGFIHGDFLPRNVCYDKEKKQLVYLDNDRTKYHVLPMPFFLKRRNLVQFSFNLYLLAEHPVESLVKCLVESYARESQWDDKRTQRELARVLEQVTARWNRDYLQELARKHGQAD